MSKTKEPAENVTARSSEYRKRMRAKGYVYLCHWVKSKFKKKVLEFSRNIEE